MVAFGVANLFKVVVKRLNGACAGAGERGWLRDRGRAAGGGRAVIGREGRGGRGASALGGTAWGAGRRLREEE